jgi:hypothetical protein
LLRSSKDNGRVEKSGNMVERTCDNVGVVIDADEGAGKWDIVKEGGKIAGVLDCLSEGISCAKTSI